MDLGSSPAAVVLVKLVTFRHILEQKQPSKQGKWNQLGIPQDASLDMELMGNVEIGRKYHSAA